MKTEIIQKIESLLEHEQLLSHSEEFKELSDQFYKITNEEERQFEIEKLEKIEAGEKPENIQKPVDALLDKFKALINDFKTRKQVEIDQVKELENTNLNAKKALIIELKQLVEKEEHIGKAIQTIKQIQEKWRAIGPIPRNQRQDIQKEYSTLMDDFQYNINIYKEIKDHDLVRNSELKRVVIEKIKGLQGENSIKLVEKKLHLYQDEWNEIGGTSAEEWDVLKTGYWDTVNDLYKKIRVFYDSRREEQKDNIIKKLALIDKVDEQLAVSCESQTDWKNVTDKIISIQEEWKTVGFGPKKENEIVWKGFRAKCDQFFNAKKEFFKDINSEYDKVRDKKLILIEKVNAIKDSTNWNETTKLIVNLQKDWKNLGSAGQRNENKLWKSFRTPIDNFFGNKEAHFEALDKDNAGNLTLKENLIADIKEYKIPKDPKTAIADLKQFSKSFSAIGNVPFKEKDKIYKAYKVILDEKYDSIDLDKTEKEKLLYTAKIDSIYNSPDRDRELDRESFSIRKRIDEKVKEKNQVENNLSFFSNSDENNPLLKNVKVRINLIEEEVTILKEKLTLLLNFDQESE